MTKLYAKCFKSDIKTAFHDERKVQQIKHSLHILYKGILLLLKENILDKNYLFCRCCFKK
jgi:hypothetical protein